MTILSHHTFQNKGIDLNSFVLIYWKNNQKNKQSVTDHVPLLVMLVFDDEDHVKTGQDGGHKVDIVFTLGIIPASKHRVGGCQHRAPWIQGGGDASLEWAEETNITLGNMWYASGNGAVHGSIYCTFAMEMVCCSMASWIATLSSSLI